ncbi:MAG: hypothetical protein ACREHV_03040 [Rhizomicrobium sp.]
MTLTAGRLLRPGTEIPPSLALRIGIATSLTTLFVFFIAHYAELRAELSYAERQLNLLGLQGIEWAILGAHSGGSMQERTLRRRYSSSLGP